MNTKLLKQKILDLAIRGKLTQQLKSDGTARELLEQISSKVSSSSSTLSSPRRRGSPSSSAAKTIIPLDKNEAPFEVPANWEWVRLGDVGKWQSGTTPSKSNSAYYKDGTIPWLNTGDLNDGIINDIPKRVTEKALAETSLRLNEAGSVCIAMYGATIGKLGILSMPATTNQACCVCNNLKSFVNRMWLFFFLMNHKQEFIEAGFGGAQPNISKEKIVSTMFPLPPLAEQQRIVAKIEEAFAEIDAIEKNKELLKTHIKQTRQKILDLAIHGKLVPQNKSDEPASVLLERITRDNPHYEKLIDIPFEIPDSWEWVKLGDVCSFFGGGTPDKSNPKYWNGSINWASVKDIKGIELTDTVDKITEAGFEESASSYAEKEDLILVTRINPGMCIQTKIKTAINQDLKVVKVPSQINKVYVMVFCNYAQKWFLEKSSGTTVKGIKIDAVLQMPFPLPPLAEQKRIVDRIEEIFKSLDEISLHLA